MIHYVTTERGFSLVETLVAVLILLIAVVAPLTIVSRSAQSSTFAVQQVTATFLAQEGLELAQQLRDERFLEYYQRLLGGVEPLNTGEQTAIKTAFDNGTLNADIALLPWFIFSHESGAFDSCFSSQGCALDVITAEDFDPLDQTTWPLSCGSTGVACNLVIDTSINPTTRFVHGTPISFEPTIYNRRIRFIEKEPGREVQVISTVSWNSGNFTSRSEVVTETALFNVYDLP